MSRQDLTIGVILGIVLTLFMVLTYPKVFGLSPVTPFADQLAR